MILPRVRDHPEHRGRATLVDLHLHTIASDGRCTPGELVERAAEAALTVIAVTDHDTTAAVAEVQSLAREFGMETVSGIEITAVEEGRDIHVLGYFVDPLNDSLQTFLAAQRRARIARVETIGARLTALGMSIDVQPLLLAAERENGRSVGRPLLARALVGAGYAADTREAFDRWLGHGCPAFVPRSGASPEVVIALIHEAGGIASLGFSVPGLITQLVNFASARASLCHGCQDGPFAIAGPVRHLVLLSM